MGKLDGHLIEENIRLTSNKLNKKIGHQQMRTRDLV